MANKKSEFQLDNGRTIYLAQINQSGTYAGLLEGVPTKEMNQGNIEHALKTAKELWDGNPYLIQPTETPIELNRDYPFGTPASIPGITCLARFKCLDAVRNDSMDYSELPIVWFQHEFAFPIADSVLADIRAIDWDQHACDYEY